MRQFTATSQDWFNYLAQGVASNALIQYVIKLGRLIDFEILKKAVCNSIIEEPVLGCKFILEEPHPRWVSTSVEIQDICCLIKTENIDLEIKYVVAQELNASTHVPIMIYLITDNISNVIVVKINHAVCDGAGSKYYLKLLAQNYTMIKEDNGVINQSSILDRSTGNFYNALGINKLEDHFNPEMIDLTSTWGFPINREKDRKQAFSYQYKQFEDPELLRIKQVATKHNTTINTVLIAAYHFALLQVIQPPAGPLREIQFMSDLRKYLPSDITQTICNLSAILNVNLPTDVKHFEEMVIETDIALKKMNVLETIKQGTIAGDLCLQSDFSSCSDMFMTDWKHILNTGNCTPMISNLGILLAEDITFGKINIDDIYFVSPAFFTPAFMLGVSTYKDKLTLCASYYTPEMQHVLIKNLLEKIGDLFKE